MSNGHCRRIAFVTGMKRLFRQLFQTRSVGAENAVVNGKEAKLDSAAFIENNRTYTSVRFVAAQLGASVEWLESEQKVIITK